jgi:2-oxoglutarate ferredoxin oxidoreductase subunit delta
VAILIDGERCKGCELCIGACPQHVLSVGARINSRGFRFAAVGRPMQCIGCRLCAIACPDAAIAVRATGTVYEYFAP